MMKQISMIGLGLITVVGLATAANQTLTGKISDSNCGMSHNTAQHASSMKMSDHDCTLACIKNGAKYVFVTNGKVYQIENQDFSSLPEYAGENVRLTGDMNGNTIKVTSIEASARKSKPGTGQ